MSPDFEDFFGRNYGRIVAFFQRRGVSLAVAEELAQDVFMKSYSSWRGFRRRANRDSWLYQIAGNHWLNHVRDSTAQKRRGLVVHLDAEENPPEFESAAPSQTRELLSRERVAEIEAALKSFPRQMRRCLALSLLAEASVQEIADLLGLSPNTAKVHLRTGRARLARHLES